MTSSGRRYTRHPAVLWRSTSRGPVVLGPDDEAPRRLVGVAAAVWEVLDEVLDGDALARLAGQAAGTEPSRAADAAAELARLGLLVEP